MVGVVVVVWRGAQMEITGHKPTYFLRRKRIYSKDILLPFVELFL